MKSYLCFYKSHIMYTQKFQKPNRSLPKIEINYKDPKVRMAEDYLKNPSVNLTQ
jgi:hypothetical protein